MINFYEGKTWRQQRKTLMPALYTQHYPNFLDVIVRNANLMVDCLRKTLDQSSVDIAQFCTLCTLDIICGKCNQVYNIA